MNRYSQKWTSRPKYIAHFKNLSYLILLTTERYPTMLFHEFGQIFFFMLWKIQKIPVCNRKMVSRCFDCHVEAFMYLLQYMLHPPPPLQITLTILAILHINIFAQWMFFAYQTTCGSTKLDVYSLNVLLNARALLKSRCLEGLVES